MRFSSYGRNNAISTSATICKDLLTKPIVEFINADLPDRRLSDRSLEECAFGTLTLS